MSIMTDAKTVIGPDVEMGGAQYRYRIAVCRMGATNDQGTKTLSFGVNAEEGNGSMSAYQVL